MKKLIALFLSLAMLCTLAIPALAADAGSSDFVDTTAAASWESTCNEEPELTARFLEELDTWFPQSFFGWFYDSLDDFIEDWGGEESAYLELYHYWSMEYAETRRRNEEITAHGGVPGQINVMVNGRCVKFPDAVPEISNGRTMIPVRALVETLGGEVDYQDKTVRFTIDGYVYKFTVGSAAVTVRPTADNDKDVPQPEDIIMDCAPYIKNNRTYIPIRFISEALGYTVGWDRDYRAAIITDLETLEAQIDEEFTILNKTMAPQPVPETAQRLTGSASAVLTLLDSLNGDVTKTGSGSLDAIVSPAGASMKMEYDFTGLWALMELFYGVKLLEEAESEVYAGRLGLAKGLLKDAWELRADTENAVGYCKMPGLNAMLRQRGADIADDAWISLDVGGLEELIGESASGSSTVGGLLCAVFTSGGGADSFEAYDDIVEIAGVTAKLAGDGKFTRTDNARTLTLTKEDLTALVLDQGGDPSDLDELSKFSFTLNLYDNGDMDVDVQCSLDMDDLAANLGDTVQFSLTASRKGGKTQAAAGCHIKNVAKLTVEFSAEVASTDESPETVPPKDAVVIPAEELMGGGEMGYSDYAPGGPLSMQP